MEVLKKVIIAFPTLAKIDDNRLKSVKIGFKIEINALNKFLSNLITEINNCLQIFPNYFNNY
ncbi:hypothetical protein [Spiroplasma endosymbiont of Polydrusus formosus]|uniref:hypothetical protein n=1 Tax=Spiroplasma endosymbiont of Polydrusus formosus TaxID=3139326 RepID=UPI0035B56CFC